jgi:uncharacterized protein (DUF433 family)
VIGKAADLVYFMVMTDHPRISRDPAIMVGKPCIKGTRVPVYIVVDCIASGYTLEQVLAGYPHLTAEDVTAALHYAAAYLSSEGTLAA